MSGSPKKKPKMPHGYKVIRGNVVDIVDRVEREVNRRTRRVERSRQWREMTLRETGGQEHTFVGEVLDRARHGDDVAVVWAPIGREPVALANLTAQCLQLHGSADPDTPEGKLSTALLVAVVGALPGLLVYYAILAMFFSNLSDSMSATALKFYPLVLLPAAWWISTKLTGWAHDRAERVSKEVEQALVAAGITSETEVRDIHGVRQVALA
ncbi:hypothetical protein [Gymnodinialimonas ulvae]|uniref:hypothetical protein n=1 Tax=Gymnodinialimonas ulvae TaxID=3126504 RepID=UPI0030A6FC7F